MKNPVLIAGAVIVLGMTAITAAAADDVEIERFGLANGVQVVIAHVPDAPNQTIYTFLPRTLVNDDANRAQWSHLLEHLIIRTTDPLELSAPGIVLNGETTHTYMRLETFATPDQWKAALERHATWLANRQFDPETLNREKGQIELEERNTAQGGFTSKFAMAAWNQIVRQHLKHAKVHGDVAGAELKEVQAYAQAKLPIDETVTIATIGPTPIEEAKKEIERTVGALEMRHMKSHAEAAANTDLAGTFRATWDFPTRHALWWWKLPESSPAIRAAAAGIARALQMQILMSPNLHQLIRQALVYPRVDTPEGCFFIIDCCLSDPQPAEGKTPLDPNAAGAVAASQQAWALIKPLVENLAEGKPRHGAIAWCGRMIVQEMAPKPDFELIRRQTPQAMGARDIAEGSWLLAQMNYEYAWGVPALEVASALQTLDEEAVKAVLERVGGDPIGKLELEPRVNIDDDEGAGARPHPEAASQPAVAPR